MIVLCCRSSVGAPDQLEAVGEGEPAQVLRAECQRLSLLPQVSRLPPLRRRGTDRGRRLQHRLQHGHALFLVRQLIQTRKNRTDIIEQLISLDSITNNISNQYL